MKFFVFALLFVLTGCFEKDQTPESALKDFIEARMGNIVTKDAVLGRVTGPMKASLESISDEEFEKSADLRNIRQDSFKVLDKECKSDKCLLTYSISYQTSHENKAAFKSEVKKVAEVQQVEGKWLISDVSNIKTFHESVEPIIMDDKAL